MPLRIKEEPLEMFDSSSSTDYMPYIKEEVLELTDNSSTNCMPLRIKEEPPELSDSSLSTNCMPLNFKEVPLEQSDSSSLINSMPLNITDEMPDNVFLKIEIEENPESRDSSISPVTTSNNDRFYSKNKDVNIDDNSFKRKNASEEHISKTGTSSCRSFPYTGETNVCEHDLINNGGTLINLESKNDLIKQTTNETATVPDIIDAHNPSYSSLPLIIPLQDVPCSSGSSENTNNVLLTNPQCPTNVLPRSSVLHVSNSDKHINDMVTKFKVVQRRNAWEVKYSNNVLRGVDDETLKLLVSKPSHRFCSANEQLSHLHARTNDGVRTENVEPLVNKNISAISKDPMSMINQNIPSISKDKPNIPNDKNSATKAVVINNGKIWEIRDEKKNVVRGINKITNESVDPTLNQNIPPISIESFKINPNISSILKEKPNINPNNPSIIKDGSSVIESSSVQAGKVWEIRGEEDNAMRGCNKGTLEHNKNTLSFIKELNNSIHKDPESTTNRNIPSITKENPIINPNNPCILSNENSSRKPALLKAGKIWEIRDEKKNVVRGINKVRNEIVDPTLNQNIPPISIESFIINPNIPSILKEKPILNPNNPCIIKDGSSATESSSVPAGKVWEIRDKEHNVMRGCDKGTLEHNKNILSLKKELNNSIHKDPEPATNRNIPSITKEKPIINTNNPCIIKDGSSAIESSSVQIEKVWEIRDEEHNVMRGCNKGTLEHNKNTLSLIKELNNSIYKDPEPTTNRKIPSITKEKPIINTNNPCIIKDGSSAIESSSVQAGKVWEIRDEEHNIMRGCNKGTLENNKNILSLIKELNSSIHKDPEPTTNRNIPSITKEKPIINTNNPCIIKDGSSAIESSSVQTEKVWELRDEEHNVMRGCNKGTLEHNKNILSLIQELNNSIYPEPTTNRNIPSITKENPIINPNTPPILSNENSAIKPALLKTGKFWEIRDKQRNVIRGINKETLKHFLPKSSGTTSSQNKSPNNESFEKRGKKNAGLLQSTNETKISNKGSRLGSHTVRNLTFLVEHSGKTTDIRISDEHAESRERGLKNVSQFQNMQDKEKSNPRSLLRSSHVAHSSTILTEGMGKSINERMSPKINKRTPEYGRGALVYDRVNSRPQISALTKRLQPLYKYIKNNKCLLCGFESKSADVYGVRRHLVCHLQGRNLKCDICDKYFSAAGLPAHKANIHGKSKSKVSCKDCNLSFSTKGSLVTHRRKHHKPAQTYTCSICNHEFKEGHSLKEHCRIHTGEKPFACTVCSETFRTRGMLNSHYLRHNKEKLYSCKLCDKSYNNKGLMTEHMNSHKGTSDIKCDICGKTFNYKSNLAQHMFTHSDKRPHKCETCGLKFKLSHHLRSHLATHHA